MACVSACTQIYTHVNPESNANTVRERMNKFFLEYEINTGPNASVPISTGPRGSGQNSPELILEPWEVPLCLPC
jgi:hypothetical protein